MLEPVKLARELARIARENQLAEIEYRNETTRLRLIFERETPPLVAMAGTATVAAGQPMVIAPGNGAPPEPEREEKAAGPTVNSPLAGVFYRAPRPGAPPFVEAGATVGVGDTLCIVEAMKLMNEITAEQPMRIRKILVENASVVEAGQALFEYEPIS